MAYPTINANRIAYNIDGTRVAVAEKGTAIDTPILPQRWLTQTDLDNAQSDTTTIRVDTVSNSNYSDYTYMMVFFFFSEKKDIKHFTVRGKADNYSDFYYIEGSNDTTDGVNGTWERATIDTTQGQAIYNTVSTTNYDPQSWWREPANTTFTTSGFKVVRAYFRFSRYQAVYNIHIYGNKATGETPDDIVFLESDGVTEYNTLHDYGAVEEGTITTTTTYIKNTSSTKTANSIDISLDGKDSSNFTISTDGTTFGTTANITNLGAGATQVLYVKNNVGDPPQILNPRNVYVQVSVGSWT